LNASASRAIFINAVTAFSTFPLTAIFIACGQDVANVANAAVGVSTLEMEDDGSLWVSVHLPALTIATVKAILVALFFMHLLHDKKVNAIIAVAGFLFLGIFLMFCLIDAESRDGLQPRNLPAMDKGFTPVPDTLNPLLTAPPKPSAD
jgi:caa(3)-type oxidase subunit IV